MYPDERPIYKPLRDWVEQEAKRKARLENARAIAWWAFAGFGLWFTLALLAAL